MTNKQYYTYILASKPYGTLYIGVTNNLIQRIYQHKNELTPGFTKKYHIHTLVYYETHREIHTAIDREKKIKKWKRNWKIALIEKINPQWRDLYPELLI